MSKPMHISEIMHQLVLSNPDDPFAQILRHCPYSSKPKCSGKAICHSMTSQTKKSTDS